MSNIIRFTTFDRQWSVDWDHREALAPNRRVGPETVIVSNQHHFNVQARFQANSVLRVEATQLANVRVLTEGSHGILLLFGTKDEGVLKLELQGINGAAIADAIQQHWLKDDA
jgi:hypothetical protein